MPKIAKMVKMKIMKKNTRMRPGIEPRRTVICDFIEGSLLIERKGLRIRNVRRALRLSVPPSIGRNPTMLTQTIKKSRTFQASNKYDFLCRTKPIATILMKHSKMKTAENPMSIFSCVGVHVDSYSGSKRI